MSLPPSEIMNMIHQNGSSDVPKKATSKYRYKMKTYQKIIFYGLGSVLLLLGLFVSGFWKHFFEHAVAQEIILANNSDSQSYDSWSKNTVPVYFNIRLFNWTNPEITSGEKVKPHFVEVGPYVYKFTDIKEDIVWNPNGTVTYAGRRKWVFDAALSNGSESDFITNINVIVVVIINNLKNFGKPLKVAVNELMKRYEHNVYITKTVKELLFDGYNDELLNIANKFKKIFPKLKVLPDRFGWYFGKNFTNRNIFNMFTGIMDVNKIGLLTAWNYSDEYTAYDGDCGKVRGSVGDLWPFNAAHQRNISLFIPDFCGDFVLQNGGSRVVQKLDGILFEGDKFTFDNGTHHSELRCYCPDYECNLKSGVRNVSRCVNAPVFVSFPHFYAADESYRNVTSGLKPNKKKHRFQLTLQKDSGLTLEAFARLQVNLFVEPVDGFHITANLPTGLIPVFWFEETAKLPPTIVHQLQFSFNTIPNLLAIFGLILVIIGSVLLVIGLVLTRMSYQTIPYTAENL